ncbi:hypothetical protein CI109_105142 [Kwoniella shandongensis]|uniref:Uncharacterized protein n=1 Tax=Kwoniella shandongensis TaxID=1734106 RepID=A0A5M6C363_9TREE|nr:uncharacterized protein CI109_001981 [Kwoniella shandongensis]KAA5529556.1 hypothetical protein CI109_001981 [Kwoniella shandongensis]
MPPRSTKPPSVESLLPPILSLLPNAYSAHQKCLTTTARLVHANHHDIAIPILFATAKELLKLGEGGSGSELGVKMVGIMSESDVQVDEKSRASITQLLALTPSSGPWRKKLADAAIKWTQANGDCPTGDPNLHQYIGELYYKDRAFVAAEPHLLSSGKRDAAITLAEMMFEWSEKGKLDPGPYAIRGTLPFLAQSPPSILPALTFLSHLLSLLSSSSSPFHKNFITTLPSQTSFSISEVHLTTSPTLNFCQLALVTVQRAPAQGVSGVTARGMDGGMGREWDALCGRYTRMSGASGVLGQREVQEVLQQIATEIFLTPPPRAQGGNDMLQNLMGSLFGGGGGGGGGAIGAR